MSWGWSGSLEDDGGEVQCEPWPDTGAEENSKCFFSWLRKGNKNCSLQKEETRINVAVG